MINLYDLTTLTKEDLLKQVNDLLESGQDVLCVKKGGHDDFYQLGFQFFITFSFTEFDETVYVNEKAAHLFHDAYSFNSMEFVHEIIEHENWEMLETMLLARA